MTHYIKFYIKRYDFTDGQLDIIFSGVFSELPCWCTWNLKIIESPLGMGYSLCNEKSSGLLNLLFEWWVEPIEFRLVRNEVLSYTVRSRSMKSSTSDVGWQRFLDFVRIYCPDFQSGGFSSVRISNLNLIWTDRYRTGIPNRAVRRSGFFF